MDAEAKQAFETGMAMARAGNPTGAAAAFTEAVNREPTWLMARLNRGSAWFLAPIILPPSLRSPIRARRWCRA